MFFSCCKQRHQTNHFTIFERSTILSEPSIRGSKIAKCSAGLCCFPYSILTKHKKRKFSPFFLFRWHRLHELQWLEEIIWGRVGRWSLLEFSLSLSPFALTAIVKKIIRHAKWEAAAAAAKAATAAAKAVTAAATAATATAAEAAAANFLFLD